ncbi:glycosyltransferase 87 family protein [Paraburkholderia sp. C35]|uniref:glycosyltransferase 87 family protein n=1 Tax=Paraburkholderia sp. C35 TaxID=2126993 RepID=UPI000D68C28E|nr:glycosyltransferase 87 family protein [Paraburkholderia sp. C35]
MSTTTRTRIVDLRSRRAMTVACVIVPLLFGLYSLMLGADANWDLYNYHLYNPFAWLHGKLQTDLAPAGMQTYFNPLLDSALYLLNTHLPSRVVGFLLGVLHGSTFVLIVAIARQVWPATSDDERYRLPVLIAAAGCLTANFLSGLGNSMGDDTTALLVLGGLLIALSNWQRLGEFTARAVAASIASGLLVGFATGLKLTNALFAVALCVSLLSYPGALTVRVRIAFLFGVGVLLGMATTTGFWMLHLWQQFGNPLYPQFGKFFPNPLTIPAAQADTRWLPRNLAETLLWPFIIAADSKRVGETPIRQIIWPIVYVVFVWWALVRATVRFKPQARAALEPKQRFVVLFVVLGFVVWMKLFSIYRYIVPIEMLAPMVLVLLLDRLLPARVARRASKWLLIAATVVVVTGGARTWGHEGWADPLYHAHLPPLAQPERTTVVIRSTTTGWAWIATRFPDTVAFTQIDSSFPASDAFRARVVAFARERGGPSFALIDGAHNWREDSVNNINDVAATLGLTRSAGGCHALNWAVSKLRLHAAVETPRDASEQCHLGLRADDRCDLAARNRQLAADAAAAFERAGFSFDASSCTPYEAGIGKGVLAWQWCRIAPR